MLNGAPMCNVDGNKENISSNLKRVFYWHEGNRLILLTYFRNSNSQSSFEEVSIINDISKELNKIAFFLSWGRNFCSWNKKHLLLAFKVIHYYWIA